jgi:hypothetical protein
MTTKRFKAAVIGGLGYGGAELIRLPARRARARCPGRLHRRAARERSPNLEGCTELKLEGLTPGEAVKGMAGHRPARSPRKLTDGAFVYGVSMVQRACRWSRGGRSPKRRVPQSTDFVTLSGAKAGL